MAFEHAWGLKWFPLVKNPSLTASMLVKFTPLSESEYVFIETTSDTLVLPRIQETLPKILSHCWSLLPLYPQQNHSYWFHIIIVTNYPMSFISVYPSVNTTPMPDRCTIAISSVVRCLYWSTNLFYKVLSHFQELFPLLSLLKYIL